MTAMSNPRPDEAIDDGGRVPTVPWPTLSDGALQGKAGDIVRLVNPHTEADPAALLVQTLGVAGGVIGRNPHIKVGNDIHPGILHPVIVGRTASGAKGTSYGVVNAIRKLACPDFDANIVSGLTSAEGLIELVRDGTPAKDANADNYDEGVRDKRLLVTETEYRSVLTRARREGNTLGPTLRQAWDGETLRTLARKHNRLIATDPHIVVVGHITPREFRETLCSTDLSGGSVNRLLICLSRRSKLHSRFGNVPENVLAEAADIFSAAVTTAGTRPPMHGFTDSFWDRWDAAYRYLNRERPESDATDASARAVPMVLRMALLYSLLDCADKIDVQHLRAALKLWQYCEHSVRWLFSSHQLEQLHNAGADLAMFIREGGRNGRTRTDISRGFYQGNKPAAEIDADLAPLVHDGTIIEDQIQGKARKITRYTHRSVRTNETTKRAVQAHEPDQTDLRTNNGHEPPNSSPFVGGRNAESVPNQHVSSSSLIRTAETS